MIVTFVGGPADGDTRDLRETPRSMVIECLDPDTDLWIGPLDGTSLPDVRTMPQTVKARYRRIYTQSRKFGTLYAYEGIE